MLRLSLQIILKRKRLECPCYPEESFAQCRILHTMQNLSYCRISSRLTQNSTVETGNSIARNLKGLVYDIIGQNAREGNL
jgi:hypothetical protein